ncbi:MAG: asparagine synthase C-terminal domain-containing protein, partial [Candidatus Altiarchaeota archaeon]
VPLGVLLSGGLDSSSIVSVMARSPGKGLKSFSIGFDEKDPELSRARKVSGLFGTENFELVFKPADIRLLPDIIHHLGEPINLLPGLYSLALSNRIREECVTVVLAGNGADELFGGYDYHNQLLGLEKVFRFSRFFPRKLFGFAASFFGADSRIGVLLRLFAASPDKRKGEVYRRKAQGLKDSLYSDTMRHAVSGVDAGKPLDDVFNEQEGASYFDRMLYTELFMGNMHSTVVIADVAGMMNSIEIRAPFLDHKVMEFAASLPVEMKVPSMLDRSLNKFVMKQAMAGVLPEDIIYGRKMGFGYNIDWSQWLRGEWKPLAEDILLGRALPETGLFEMDSVRRLIDDHACGARDNSTILWGLITFEIWYEMYFKGRPPEKIISEEVDV